MHKFSSNLSRCIKDQQNEEEKRFINTLVQTSQAIHEQELITKGNELRRVSPLSCLWWLDELNVLSEGQCNQGLAREGTRP